MEWLKGEDDIVLWWLRIEMVYVCVYDCCVYFVGDIFEAALAAFRRR